MNLRLAIAATALLGLGLACMGSYAPANPRSRGPEPLAFDFRVNLDAACSEPSMDVAVHAPSGGLRPSQEPRWTSSLGHLSFRDVQQMRWDYLPPAGAKGLRSPVHFRAESSDGRFLGEVDASLFLRPEGGWELDYPSPMGRTLRAGESFTLSYQVVSAEGRFLAPEVLVDGGRATWDAATATLAYTAPATAGEYTLRLRFSQVDACGHTKAFTEAIPLHVAAL